MLKMISLKTKRCRIYCKTKLFAHLYMLAIAGPIYLYMLAIAGPMAGPNLRKPLGIPGLAQAHFLFMKFYGQHRAF